MSPQTALATYVLAVVQVALCAQEPTVTWRGEARTLEAVRKEAPATAESLAKWLPFAAGLRYRLVLSEDRRVLLGLSSTFARKQPKKENHETEVMVDLIRDTCVAADRFLGPGAKDGAPLVVFCMRSADYPKLLDHVATMDARIKDWAEKAGRVVSGFTLSEPLVAAWIEDPAGVDEWHPYNELVHRTAQLMVRSKAPQLPHWLLLGLGWHVEDTLRTGVYCFPYRSSFVSAAEHADWGLWLANSFRKDRREKARKPPVLAMEEFATWTPHLDKDEFETGRAYIAFGVARYLAHEHPTKVLPLLEKLHAGIVKGSRVTVSETEWRTDPDYQLPVADQLTLLRELDDKFLAKVTDWFQKKKANERRPVSNKSLR